MLALILALAATGTAASPADWAGTWAGTCKLTPAFQGVEHFDASLTIGRTERPDTLRWTIIYAYESAPREVRDYALITVDAAGGRYAIDEKNGLLLDAAFSDGVLYAPFAIGSLLVTATYEVSGDGMRMNLPSFDRAPSRETCLTGQDGACAQSFRLSRSQHCWLKRQDMRKLD